MMIKVDNKAVRKLSARAQPCPQPSRSAMSLPTSSLPSRRRARRPLHKEPSILGRLKSYVTESFGWSDDEQSRDQMDSDDRDAFENDSDLSGKRRRVFTERENREPKRQRVSSPDQGGYLDPPVSAFPAVQRPGPRLSQPLTLGTLSLVEPYQQTRDFSLPPNPYRLRMSQTPSELRESAAPNPPPVTSLMSHPVFVRNPSQGPDMSRSLSRQPIVNATTLGMLANSHRRVSLYVLVASLIHRLMCFSDTVTSQAAQFPRV